MTATRASLKKSLKALLVRDGTVRVSKNYSEVEDLRGKKLTIASKGTTVCNGKGRCASEDHCVGLSVFVTDPKVPAAKKTGDKKIGWRHGTVKICLTHLEDESGIPFIDLDQPLPPRGKRTGKSKDSKAVSGIEELPNRVFEPVGNGKPQTLVGVTWQELAYAHQEQDTDLLATYCRTLKAEHEKMALRLLNAQAKLLEQQEVPHELRSLSRVRSG